MAWLWQLGLVGLRDGREAGESMVTPHKHLRGYAEKKKSDQIETKTPESDGLGML